MLEELEKRGKYPEYIVGSCGGAIAAAIAKSYSTSAEQKKFLESKYFHTFLRKIKFHKNSLTSALGIVGGTNLNVLLGERAIPDLFDDYILDIPAAVPLRVGNFSPEFPRVVLVADRLRFGPEHVGRMMRENGHYHEETYFTDPETAQQIEGLASAAALSDIDSFVGPKAKVKTNVSLAYAMRASIADPYYMKPLRLDDGNYITGAVNLYPLEMARQLAETVIMPYAGSFDTLVEANVFETTFGFNNEARLDAVTKQKASYWVDISDTGELYTKVGLNPSPVIASWEIQTGVPEDHKTYLRRVRALWNYGRSRMAEALDKEPGTKKHIRQR
jgi:hypothetical protein